MKRNLFEPLSKGFEALIRSFNAARLKIGTVPWSRLHKIRALPLYDFSAFALIAVPIFASLCIFLHNQFDLDIPIPADLLSIYFSSLFFYAASAIVDLYCPDLVSRFKIIDDYLRFSEVNIDKEDEGKENDQESLIELECYVESLSEAVIKAEFNVMRPELWNARDLAHPNARMSATAFYILSLGVAVYATIIDAPLKVAKALWL